MDLTDIIRKFHPNTKEYCFFSAIHGIFSNINHIICHNASLYRYKDIEITHSILLTQHGLMLDFNNNRNNREPTYSWKLKNFLLNANWIMEEIKKEMKDCLEFNKIEGVA